MYFVKLLASLLFLLLMVPSSESFTQGTPIHQQLFDSYDQFKESSINHRRFKHTSLIPLLERVKHRFPVKKVGQSIEGRSLFLVKIGNGPKKVLLWSQMHGDEPTATMAIMDLFNFFYDQKTFVAFKESMLEELSLYFIPMLNPDGAERYQRRNAIGVDLNRDALRLQNPESRTLKNIRDSLDADWGFNLHDQSKYYGAGNSGKNAAISFLAPAYNPEKDINTVRGNAMKLIVDMNAVLQQYIPGQIARYSDEFEPRAFGDNIQKWGTSTILIESGGLAGDPEKQELRKLHFVTLLTAFQSIATKSYDALPLAGYDDIPFNDYDAFHDLIIREATLMKNGKPYIVDIAFRQYETDFVGHNDFFFRSAIRDIGDLHTFSGHAELDAEGFQIIPAKLYPKTLASVRQFKGLDPIALLRQGYGYFKIKKTPTTALTDQLPFRFLGKEEQPNISIAPGQNPSLFLEKDGTLHYAIVNGFLHDLNKDAATIVGDLEKL